MKRPIAFLFALLLAAFGPLRAAETVVSVQTQDLALVYTVDAAQRLMFRHFGPRLRDEAELGRRKSPAITELRAPRQWEAYPAYGRGETNEPALAVVHADGSLVTELSFVERKEIPATQPGVKHSVFVLRDLVKALTVELHTEAYTQANVFAQWVEVSHQEADRKSVV